MKFLYSSVFYVFSLLPQWFYILLGKGVGWFLQHILRFRRKIILENIDIVYKNHPEKKPSDLLKRIYRHFGLLLFEILRLPYLSDKKMKEIMTFEGLDYMNNALAKGKGVFCVTGHVGNWEYSLTGGQVYGLEIAVVVKELRRGNSKFIYELLRGKRGILSIAKKQSVKKILRTLKENKVLAFVLDQRAKKTEGIFVDFFGEPASTFTAPYIIAKKTGCPIVPIYSFRNEDMKTHTIRALEEVNIDLSSDNDEAMRKTITKLSKITEQFILEHPEQWIWMHRRWKNRSKYNES